MLLALVAGCFCWGWTASAITFTATLDRNSIAVGETATLSLTFQDGAPDGTPALPPIDGLDIAYEGPSTQTSFVFNGATTENTSTTTHNFAVTAKKPGTYQIPALSIEINGVRLSSQPLTLTVTGSGAPTAEEMNNGSQVAFVKLVLPKKEMYVGETAVAELQIWLRDDVINFGNLQLPNLTADGFNLGKMSMRPRSRAQAGNRLYTIAPVAITVTAIKSGTLTLGPLTAQMTIVLAFNGQNGDPLQRFFNQGERKDITLNSDTYNVQGLNLPPNAPAGFTGAIGRFQMNVAEGPTTVNAGDPITLHVRIQGSGALDTVKMPDLSGWNGFKIYPASAKTESSDGQGLEGTKTFEEIVTPQNADVRAIPAFSFAYFDPERRQYQTLSQAAVPIVVHAAGALPMPSATTTVKTTDNPAAPADILPVKQDLGPVIATGTPLLLRPGFLAWQSLPVLAFLAALIWRRRTDSLANNPRLRRQRAVVQLVQAGMADLRKFAGENNSEQFFATLFRLLQEQLGERLDCPASAITESVVDDRLATLKAQPATLAALRELFQLCNQARYAPVRDPQELAAVAAKFETAARELQALKV